MAQSKSITLHILHHFWTSGVWLVESATSWMNITLITGTNSFKPMQNSIFTVSEAIMTWIRSIPQFGNCNLVAAGMCLLCCLWLTHSHYVSEANLPAFTSRMRWGVSFHPHTWAKHCNDNLLNTLWNGWTLWKPNPIYNGVGHGIAGCLWYFAAHQMPSYVDLYNGEELARIHQLSSSFICSWITKLQYYWNFTSADWSDPELATLCHLSALPGAKAASAIAIERRILAPLSFNLRLLVFKRVLNFSKLTSQVLRSLNFLMQQSISWSLGWYSSISREAVSKLSNSLMAAQRACEHHDFTKHTRGDHIVRSKCGQVCGRHWDHLLWINEIYEGRYGAVKLHSRRRVWSSFTAINLPILSGLYDSSYISQVWLEEI